MLTTLVFGLSLLAAGPLVELGGVSSKAPAAWKETPSQSSMRVKQFTVPGKGGDAEVIVFFFGGQGGGVDENVKRWKGMFEPPAGKTIDDVSKMATFKLAKGKATLLDVQGTYLFRARPMDPDAERRPHHRMLAVVLETPEGPYFIRFVGPEKNIAAQKKAFEGWIKNFK